MTADSSLKKIRRAERKKPHQTRILYLVKLSLKNEGIIKAFRYTKAERIHELTTCITRNAKEII